MRFGSRNLTATRVPRACAAGTRSNCNPSVAKTPLAPSHRPPGGADVVPATQLDPMQQPVGARQTAINRKLLFQYALCVDPRKPPPPVPLRRGASDHPFLEPRARHGVDPRLSTGAPAGHAILQCR